MSRPRPAKLVNLFMSLIGSDRETIGAVLVLLMERFGDADYIGPCREFTYTDYYEQEMGSGLQRRFVSFAGLMPPDSLPDVKLWTNDLERRFSVGEARRINIDPGYLSESHLILATGKGFAHRPYLRDGIYADLTLIYSAGSFRPLPWTYPDYAAPESAMLLHALRKKYLGQLQKLKEKGAS